MEFVKFAKEMSEALKKYNEADVARIVIRAYEDEAKHYKPIVKVLPKLATRILSDLVPILDELTETLVRDHGSRLAIVSQRMCDLRARGAMRNFKAYVEAGFTREEAFVLVKQDKAAAAEALKERTKK